MAKLNKNPVQKGLAAYRENKKLETDKKIEDAIAFLKKHHKPININSVANQAGVSSVTIYKRPELASKIKSCRSRTVRNRKIEGLSPNLAQMQVVIDGLKMKNEELVKENALLKQRISVQNGEIFELRKAISTNNCPANRTNNP